MKLKRFALRGLIALFVAVALCMFFARTVQTITTPKVQLITASSGRFEEKMTFRAEVYFAETEEFTVEEAEDMAITVDRVYVKPGHYVKAGETLFTAKAPSYEEEMEKLREEYDTKNKELLDLDVSNRKLSKESRQNTLYDEMLTAQDNLTDATYEARFAAAQEGMTLSGDVSTWPQQIALLGGASTEVSAAVSKAAAAQKTYEDARAAYFAILDNRQLRVKDETFNYIVKRNELQDELDELNQKMVELTMLESSLQKVVAPRDGYIVEMKVSDGDAYDGTAVAFVMNKEDTMPVLRAPLDGNSERTISDGTRADITSETYGTERTSVEKTVTEKDGTKYLQLPIPEEFASTESAAIRSFISDGGVDVSITYRAKKSTTLLSPSCVRDDGSGNYYVYIVENQYGGFLSQTTMTIRKTAVTVIEKSSSVVSIEEDLSWQQIADREDRALKDGATVMEYVN
ncbi:MAG: hypothetical protein IJ438_07025 [Clostridia bacterium]|nr:hypothetical protein [Clostridia bacterium]